MLINIHMDIKLPCRLNGLTIVIQAVEKKLISLVKNISCEEYPPTVTIKAKIDVVKEIREALTPTQFEIFEKTCFGHWLNVGLKKNSQLLIHTVLACMVEGKENELSFLILGKQIHFRRQEFCLVTGLRFGCNMYMKKWVKNLTDNPFRNRIFPHIEANVSVKLGDVIDIFDKMRKRTLVLEDNDAVRICLLVLLQQGFLGHQLSHNVSDDMLKLVEHLSNCWNIFPCGSYIWQYTYSQLRDALPRRKLLHDAKREKGEKIQYTMTGFVWAFMIWILEAIPATHRYVHKQPTEKIPRALAWESTQPFTWSRCCTLFVGDQLAPPLETLTPTKAESETDWWKASLEYFEGKHVQSEVVSEQLDIEKDGISEKKRKRGSSESSLQDPTYDQLMTTVTKLEGTVATLTETVSSLHGTIGTLESRLLALEGDERDFGVVSDGDIAASCMICDPSFWDVLYSGGEKAEYLEEGKLDGLHINAFIELIMRKRPHNAQWTLGLSELVAFHIDSGMRLSMVSVVDALRATIDGTNPSLESPENGEKIVDLLKIWKDFIKKDLENMNWFENTKRDPKCFKISLRYMSDVPKQSFVYGTLDCGVMTCKFLEMLTKGKKGRH
ncbi:phospholipase-like protein [Tanacetum coccineum]